MVNTTTTTHFVAYNDDTLTAHGPFTARSEAVDFAWELAFGPDADRISRQAAEAELADNGWTFVPLMDPKGTVTL